MSSTVAGNFNAHPYRLAVAVAVIFIHHNKQVASKGVALQVAHQGPHPSSAASLELAKPCTPSLPLSQAECS